MHRADTVAGAAARMTEFGMAWRHAKSLIQHGTGYKERLGHYYKGGHAVSGR